MDKPKKKRNDKKCMVKKIIQKANKKKNLITNDINVE